MKQLLSGFFDDAEFAKRFKFHSAAKSVHHGYVGGLLEHTLGVTKNCDFYAQMYPMLNRDLLLTAAIFHDIGKLDEISPFPQNDYTDEGQLLGHITVSYTHLKWNNKNLCKSQKEKGDTYTADQAFTTEYHSVGKRSGNK